uniref:Glutamine amidotransferase type-2 domain-containing protein n=1 Tax=viral metagenome TaxID=1070528 RepID=A0A6C0CZY8_9ZZZZ
MIKYFKNISIFTSICSLSIYKKYKEPDHVKACGIVGYVGKDSAKPFLLEGLTILQNRGYDSVGIATISPKKKYYYY